VPDVEGQVLAYVWYAFQRNGVEMPFPQRTVHMVPTKDGDRTRAEAQERILEALRRIDFLSVLSPDHLDIVARGATTRVYLPGETVVRQGEAGAEFFFILDGSAEVVREVGQKTSVMATLSAMEFFGEMSVLTGEPRSATIVAKTRLEVLVITKAVLAQPIMLHPVLAERISNVLARRKDDQAAHHLEAASRSRDPVHGQDDHARTMGARIRDFFGVAAK
jgi:CRP-like cAMP-binding protein